MSLHEAACLPLRVFLFSFDAVKPRLLLLLPPRPLLTSPPQVRSKALESLLSLLQLQLTLLLHVGLPCPHRHPALTAPSQGCQKRLVLPPPMMLRPLTLPPLMLQPLTLLPLTLLLHVYPLLIQR